MFEREEMSEKAAGGGAPFVSNSHAGSGVKDCVPIQSPRVEKLNFDDKYKLIMYEQKMKEMRI